MFCGWVVFLKKKIKSDHQNLSTWALEHTSKYSPPASFHSSLRVKTLVVYGRGSCKDNQTSTPYQRNKRVSGPQSAKAQKSADEVRVAARYILSLVSNALA
jgi:hypothetical protein